MIEFVRRRFFVSFFKAALLLGGQVIFEKNGWRGFILR